MIATLVAWFGSPLGRKVMLWGGVSALALGVIWHAYEHGKGAGEQDGKRAGIEETRVSAEQDRKLVKEQLDAGSKREEKAAEVIGQLTAAMSSASVALGKLQQQRAADQKQVSNLEDSQVVPDIARKLAVRDPADRSPTLTMPELRRVDQVVTDYPHALEGAKLLEAQLKLSQATVVQEKETAEAVRVQRDAALGYGDKMYGHYVEAYNLAQKKPNWLVRAVTLGRYKGRRIKLDDPLTLQREVTKR